MATDCARAALTATAKDNSGDPTKFKEVLVLTFPSYRMRDCLYICIYMYMTYLVSVLYAFLSGLCHICLVCLSLVYM